MGSHCCRFSDDTENNVSEEEGEPLRHSGQLGLSGSADRGKGAQWSLEAIPVGPAIEG